MHLLHWSFRELLAAISVVGGKITLGMLVVRTFRSASVAEDNAGFNHICHRLILSRLVYQLPVIKINGTDPQWSFFRYSAITSQSLEVLQIFRLGTCCNRCVK